MDIKEIELLDIEDIKETNYLRSQLDKLIDKNIYLYGAGSFGKEMCMFLQQEGISVNGFLDKNAINKREYCGYHVNLPEEIENKNSVIVIFSIVMDKEERRNVMKWLKSLGYVEIIEAQYYRSMQVGIDKDDSLSVRDYYIKTKDRIIQAFCMLKDEKSKDIYKANIESHFTRNYSKCDLYEDCMLEQYFPKNIKFNKGYNRFIDCGGYIGDTINSLVEIYKNKVDLVAVFEPDINNYKTMTSTVHRLVKESYCYPCAVSDESGFCGFSAACGSGTIMKNSENKVISISLDEALQGFHPSFIKMDIEGAELKALAGAKNIIKEDVPDLAICVYHNVNHLWDIILLLNSWQLGYEFYLRSYNAYTMETVLYATKN